MDFHDFSSSSHTHPTEEPDMPLGLGLRIAQDVRAMQAFSALSDERRQQLIGYVQAATTGEDAKARIRNAVSMLSRGATEI